MKIVKPWIEIPKLDGVKIMKNLEYDAKQCYHSQNNIQEDSYDHFLRNCISRGHESVIEHEKITVRMFCDVGAYKDLTRHRLSSFSVESTRYCNYAKDKFGGELKFIEPVNLIHDKEKYELWKKCMQNIEDTYNKMASMEATADQLRMLLPHSTAAELVWTSDMREWRHILSLRASKYAHPSIQQLLIPYLLYLKKEMPALFDDVEYNEEFPKENYAELRIRNDDIAMY